MTDTKTVTGGCQCGAVRYEAEADLSQAIECNCSHCQAKGLILTFTPVEKFSLITGDDVLTEYRFNKREISHRFCSKCGVQPFGLGSLPDGTQMAAINLRCVEGIELSKIEPKKIDGRSF